MKKVKVSKSKTPVGKTVKDAKGIEPKKETK
jgi:hypothetical protein